MPRQFRRLSHSVYECKYHIVFCPKYRYRILTGEVATYVHQELLHLCRQKDGIDVLEANVQADHVHVVLIIPPKYAVSSIMGYLKGKLAIRVLNRYSHLRQSHWGGDVWSRGYCVSTIGIEEEKIRQYVKWQEDREKRAEVRQKRLFD